LSSKAIVIYETPVIYSQRACHGLDSEFPPICLASRKAIKYLRH